MSKVYKIEVTARTIAAVVGTLLFIIAFPVIQELFFSFILAFIIMSAFNPAVSRMEKFRIPRVISAFIIFVASITALSYAIAWIIPPVVQETAILIKNLPVLMKELNPNLTFDFKIDQNALTPYLTDITDNAFSLVRSTFSNALFVITTIFFSFYLLVDEHVIRKMFYRFMSKSKADEISLILSRVESRMRAWLWGQLILMVSIGLITFVSLSLLQVPYAAPLSLFAGLLEVIPIMGPIISAVPTFLIAAAQTHFLGLTVIALYFFIQQIENQILVPIVMRQTVGLSPIVTLTALIIGGKFAGVIGILIAVPLTLCIETILIETSRIRNGSTAEKMVLE